MSSIVLIWIFGGSKGEEERSERGNYSVALGFTGYSDYSVCWLLGYVNGEVSKKEKKWGTGREELKDGGG